MSEPTILGFRTPPLGDVPALLARLAKARGGLPIQLVRADRVHGRDHLRHAATLAARAIAEGRARTADLPTETLLYAAGERQVGRAIDVLGLRDGLASVAAVAWGEDAVAAIGGFAAAEEWTRDDATLQGGPHVLDAFGVTQEERALISESRHGDIILERVALVDVLKA